jgi:hypothetical protein
MGRKAGLFPRAGADPRVPNPWDAGCAQPGVPTAKRGVFGLGAARRRARRGPARAKIGPQMCGAEVVR